MLLHEGWEGGVAARENFLSARSDRRNAFEQWLATLLPEDRVSQELLSALGQLALVLSDGYLFVQLVEPDGVSAKAFSEFASSLLAAVVEEAQLGPQAPEDSGSPLALTKTR